MGIGDWGWGLGIGDWDWANPHPPIPNPQSPIPDDEIFIKMNNFIINIIDLRDNLLFLL